MVDLSTDPGFFALLTDSYARLVKAPLVPPEADARWLYSEAPFAVLAHGTDHDPKFTYANKAAQDCFEYSLEELVALPSRLSAEPTDRAERQRLLDQVARNGFLAGYSGIRIAKSGRRFVIEDGIIWELIDGAGVRHGQAATFRSWRNV
ncbi:MAG TPA: MEKHLA domain-containing protein [Methyloceanibacter sp.]|nr:MEKHLA domain-containing protein [Methyloceanibacter sp.]